MDMIQGIYFGPVIIIGLVFMAIGMIVSYILKRKFKKYSKTPLRTGLSGKEIAEKMLEYHGINDVQITCVEGQLTDHYNPMNKTVNLSMDVYSGRDAAAAAIASHECGHAVQHAKAYKPLILRSKLVPVQNASAKVINVIIMISIFGGAFIFNKFPIDAVLYTIITAYGIMTLFTFITLPVEFDASRRALVWIQKSGIITQNEYQNSKDALTWAAMTYVVAALGSLATLMYYVSLLSGRND